MWFRFLWVHRMTWDLSPPPPPAPVLTSPTDADTLPAVHPPQLTGEGGSPPPPSEPPSPAGDVALQDAQQSPQAPSPAFSSAPPIHPIPRVLEARQTHLLSGSSGAGKTSLVGWMSGQLLSGQPLLGHPCSPPPFMAYIAGDRTIGDAIEKLERGGWANPAYYSLVDDDSSTAENYVRSLRGSKQLSHSLTFFHFILKSLNSRYCPELPRIPVDSLLWVDGMAPFFNIEPAGSYLKVAGPLLELNRFCKNWRITIILVTHASKQLGPDQRYTRVQDRVLGSMALQGFTSTQMFLAEPELSSNPEAGLHEFFWRSHSSAPETHEFKRSDSGVFEYIGPHWDVPAQPSSTPVTGPQLEVLSFISDEWVPAGAIREHLPSIAKTTFFRYIDRLTDAGLIEREVREAKVVWVRRRQLATSS